MRRVAIVIVVTVLIVAGCRHEQAPLGIVGDPERGRLLMPRYGCPACHRIPGVPGGSDVGPPLDHMARRSYIAGKVKNTPIALVQWIRHPQSIDPRTAMTDCGAGERDARDMAAWLLTLK